MPAHCINCSMAIPNTASICPFCRESPREHRSYRLQREQSARDAEKFAKKRAAELAASRRERTERDDYLRAHRASGSESNSDIEIPWLAIGAGLVGIALVWSLFSWMGRRVELRVGEDLALISCAVLVLALAAALYVAYRALSEPRSKMLGFAPLVAWTITMLLVLFLPDSFAAGGGRSVGDTSSPSTQATLPAQAAATDRDLGVSNVSIETSETTQQAANTVSPAIEPVETLWTSVGTREVELANGEIARRQTYECKSSGDIWYVFEVGTAGPEPMWALTMRSSLSPDYEHETQFFFSAPEVMDALCA